MKTVGGKLDPIREFKTDLEKFGIWKVEPQSDLLKIRVTARRG